VTIDALLQTVSSIYVDTAPFIYFIEDTPEFSSTVTHLFSRLGTFSIYTSTLTLTETLTKPLKTGDTYLVQNYRNLLKHTKNIYLLSVNSTIAEYTAEIRAEYRLKTPDALHIATALYANCPIFLTNDIELKRVQQLDVIMVTDLH
jgi:predicted nucleic acid-binding protein